MLNLNFNDATVPMAPIQSNALNLQGSQGTNTGITSAVTSGVPNSSGFGSFFKNPNGSFNTQNLGLALGGVQMLGNLWNSYQQGKIAKDQLNLSKKAFETNLANNTQTYNTALEDRIRARHATEGKSSDTTESYISKHSL